MKREVYIYPQFSKYELPGVRIAGPGLGNLLFMYSRALIISYINNAHLIWPTWFSIRPGCWIRHEKDKRTYHDLFHNNSAYTGGIHKLWVLLTRKRHLLHGDMNQAIHQPGLYMVTYEYMKMEFHDLLQYHDLISKDILRNLKKKNRCYESFDFSNVINVHIRLGDFTRPVNDDLEKGRNNISTPVIWYQKVIEKINHITQGRLRFVLFSDGTDEELQEVLKIANVKRMSWGNAISDLMALSQSKVCISSGSSYSLWARYLGQSSCIAYTNQRKDRVLTDNTGFEIETGMDVDWPEQISQQICRMYHIVF